MLHFTFNTLPVSINKLYVNLRGQSRRFVSAEGRAFKQLVEDVVHQELQDPNLLLYVSALKHKRLDVTIKITSPSWVLKDGVTVRKKDAMNYEKALTDSIFKTLQEYQASLDDSQIWTLTLTKEVGTADVTEYTISEHKS